MTLLNVVMLPG